MSNQVLYNRRVTWRSGSNHYELVMSDKLGYGFFQIWDESELTFGRLWFCGSYLTDFEGGYDFDNGVYLLNEQITKRLKAWGFNVDFALKGKEVA